MRLRGRTRRLLLVLGSLALATGVAWLCLGWAGDLAFRRGLQAKRDWQLGKAVRYFTWAHRLKRSNIDARLELGLCEQLRGDFLASQKHLQALTTIRIEDRSELSRLHNAIGVNHYSFNEPDAAISAHEKALELARRGGDRRLEAEALVHLGRALYHSKGKFYEALAHLEQAHAIGKEISDEWVQASALRNLGVVFWWFKGELDRPLNEFYFPALELYRRQNDQRGAATMLTLIAMVHNNKGDIYQFMRYQNESVEIQERIGDQAGLADSYMTLGILYSGIGNYRKARDYFSRGLEITRRTGYRLAGNDLDALLADVQVNLGEYDEALKLYDPDLKHKDPNSTLSNYTLQYIAHCYQLKGDHAQALALYERALQVHEKAGLPDVRFRANALLRAAECSIGLGDWLNASRYWSLAQAAAQNGETHSEGEIRQALVAASIAQHEGHYEEALKYLRNAVDVEERMFSAAQTNLLIPPHRRSYEMLFRFLLDLSISQKDPKLTQTTNELIFGFLENMRYRSLRNFVVQTREKRIAAVPVDEQERRLSENIKRLSEKLKTTGDNATRENLRRAYSEYEELTLKAQLQEPQYLAITAAKPVALPEFQRTLSANSALVQFLIVGDRVFALAISKNRTQAIQLPGSKNSLAAKVKLFRSLVLTDEADETDWRPVAESLRANLITPLEQSSILEQITTLGFVPHGFLHDLPFAALARDADGKLKVLIEDYALFQAPSATFLTHRETEKIARTNAPTAIAFGRNRSADANLAPLTFAAEEAEVVARTAGGTARLNEQATETELKRLAPDTDYLHLSTHGVAENEAPLFSRVVLEPTATDDGNLTVREIFELGLRADLVTLSACETGRSFPSGGYDFSERDRLGLIEAFLHANSRSVLASLLPVSDRATTVLMTRFYRELAPSRTKVDALAASQRAMLRGEIESPVSNQAPAARFNHPRFWSPFILVGAPQ
ncbi:MAG: CHAT domain-containing protein [Acidobacteriota bacterium]